MKHEPTNRTKFLSDAEQCMHIHVGLSHRTGGSLGSNVTEQHRHMTRALYSACAPSPTSHAAMPGSPPSSKVQLAPTFCTIMKRHLFPAGSRRRLAAPSIT
eukprot:3506088-Amphidinium_carterae.1